MTTKIKSLQQAVLPLALSTLILLLTGVLTANIYSQPFLSGLQKNFVPGYKVTFIELGSVRCIPCQKMQVVMKSIEKNYGRQVNIIFHDVWTPEGKPFVEVYKINAIPTQVFLDEKGKEFFRHEGYFPEEELVKVLKTKGVK
jgi:thioredoxin 1